MITKGNQHLLDGIARLIRESPDTWFFPGVDLVPESLLTTGTNACNMTCWQPIAFPTPRSALNSFYEHVPSRLPNLFEELILSYRWWQAGIPYLDLLAHPPGAELSGLVGEIKRDANLYPTLFKHRLVQFGKSGGRNYDPVCFDLRRFRRRDCPIVRVDHESILCDRELVIVEELAESFREFASNIIVSGKLAV